MAPGRPTNYQTMTAVLCCRTAKVPRYGAAAAVQPGIAGAGVPRAAMNSVPFYMNEWWAGGWWAGLGGGGGAVAVRSSLGFTCTSPNRDTKHD